jgi:DNA-binding NarL/FixJ family response regulator
LETTAQTPRKAIVVDRYPLYLEALERLLGSIGISVVIATTSPSVTRSAIGAHRPDLLVVGVEARDDELDGLSLIHEASVEHPDLRIVALSDVADRQAALAALSAGASVYVVRTAHPGDLASAIRQAFERSFYLASPQTPQPTVVPPVEDHAHRLTKREVEILRLAAEGHSNAHMARMLWVTEQTVKFHLSNVYRKINVGNRTEASRWAQTHGLLNDVNGRHAEAGTADTFASVPRIVAKA